MNWFRGHRRGGARLALMALVLQVVLTFGHAHGVAEPAAAGATTIAVAAADHAPADPSAPAEHDGDGCAICATLAMAPSGLTVAPPALPLPSTAPTAAPRADRPRPETARAAPAFQPRAPPAG